MSVTQERMIAAAAVVACCLRVASPEKVMFRDELTGCEMWRITNYTCYHGYPQATTPFSYEGRRLVCQWRNGAGNVIFDLADGSEVVFGRQHTARKGGAVFVRGHNAILYGVGRKDVPIYLYDLDTGKERLVVQLKGNVGTTPSGVIGPGSKYVMLRGDMNGDGLKDFGVKSLWTDEPPRVVYTSPDAHGYPGFVSPCPPYNRLTFFTKTDGKGSTGGRFRCYIAELDTETCALALHPATGVTQFGHHQWSGDGEYVNYGGYCWPGKTPGSTGPIRIGDQPYSNHTGTCGLSGRYMAGDSWPDSMERLEMRDLWTGEVRTAAYISTTTEPGSKIGQDHGHPAGSPDGTKVIFHSCYDLVSHRLYAIPTRDLHAGDPTIPVETTEGFAPTGLLLIGERYAVPRVRVSYERTDATHFYGCVWAEDATARSKQLVRGELVPKGSHAITDGLGRLFSNGERRPRKEYIAIVKLPDPPRAVAAVRAGRDIRVRWQPPALHREVAGYIIWRRLGKEQPKRLIAEPIPSCEYVDHAPPAEGRLHYFVRAVEHSGLYGQPSSIAWIDARSSGKSLQRGQSTKDSPLKPTAGTVLRGLSPGGLEPVQNVQAGVELVDAYDVRGSTYINPGERPASDRRSVRIRIPVAGDYVLWGRARAWQERETMRVLVDGKPLPDVRIEGAEWHWAKLGPCRLGPGEHVVELTREETYVGTTARNLARNPSFEQGLEGWTFDKDITSVDRTLSHAGSQCAKLSGAFMKKGLFQTIPLEVKPEWVYRLSFWVRGEFSEGRSMTGWVAPGASGMFSASLSPLGNAPSSTVYGNQFDSRQWHRIEIVCTSPPRGPAKRPTSSLKARPFWCPWYWGKQAGTIWVDDVEVTELGPRLRPVKVTRLLVTNVRGYTPKGLDGREAYPFPKAGPIAVAGLRQTGRSRNSITLAWNAGRAGTRGYNVYLNAGPDCPTTKYFLHTSVWGKTGVTVERLSHATSYTVKLAAINEDAIEGPAESLRAATAAMAPETHVLEAEGAVVAPPMVVEEADGVTFVVTPAAPERAERYDREGIGAQTGTAKSEFTIKNGGKYRILGRTFAPTAASNSFWFSLDGRPETLWELPASALREWAWTTPTDGQLWELAAGQHTITVRTREAGSRLDRVVVTNDLDKDKLR